MGCFGSKKQIPETYPDEHRNTENTTEIRNDNIPTPEADPEEAELSRLSEKFPPVTVNGNRDDTPDIRASISPNFKQYPKVENSRNEEEETTQPCTNAKAKIYGRPLQRESWYFGKIDVDRCVKVLGDSTVTPGTFLVRDSTSSPDTLCLSVKGVTPRGPEVFSLRIRRITNRFGETLLQSECDKMTFPSAQSLIEHYQENGIEAKGAVIPLFQGVHNTQILHDLDDSWDIEEDDITETEEILGNGNFGMVVKGKWNRPNHEPMEVALKKLKNYNDKQMTEFKKEINVLKMVYHDNIVTFFGVCSKKGITMIVTELLTKGNLLTSLRENPTTPLGDLFYYALKIASGMVFLESKDIIHRDLAARNILLGEHHLVKIADFGLSRLIPEEESQYVATSEVPLPRKWTAPEGMDPLREFTTKSDVWSYGILLTEIITRGEEPYKGLQPSEVTRDRIAHQGYRIPKDQLGGDCSQELYDVMAACWEIRPPNRPTFKEIFQQIYRLYRPWLPLQNF